MSEKVWVKWKNAGSNWLFGKVTNLAADADVDDLRKAFVMQQNLQISPGRLSVSLGAEGEVLEEDGFLQPHFVRILQGKAGPGQSKTTALLVTGTDQPPQPQGKSRFVLRLTQKSFPLMTSSIHSQLSDMARAATVGRERRRRSRRQ